MVNLKAVAEKLLEKHAIKLNKKLGQNFLIDQMYIRKEAEVADIKNKNIIEIGAGLGFLTVELAKSAKKVLAIEKRSKIQTNP